LGGCNPRLQLLPPPPPLTLTLTTTTSFTQRTPTSVRVSRPARGGPIARTRVLPCPCLCCSFTYCPLGGEKKSEKEGGLFGECRSVYIRSSTALSSGYAQETAKSRPLLASEENSAAPFLRPHQTPLPLLPPHRSEGNIERTQRTQRTRSAEAQKRRD
jgi:hypothetical protein